MKINYTEFSEEGKMKTTIFIATILIGLMAAGCSFTTYTYLSLTESNREQVEEKLIDYQQEEGVGAEVILSLKNWTEISGEILSVSDSTITICTEYSATEEELASLKYPINTVRNDEIQKLTIEGDSYVWIGIGIGILGGAAIGGLVGAATYDPEGTGVAPKIGEGIKTAGIVGLGFLVGAVAGGLIGSALSTDDIVVQVIPPGYDLSFLKPLARYPDEEPEYLKAIK